MHFGNLVATTRTFGGIVQIKLSGVIPEANTSSIGCDKYTIPGIGDLLQYYL